MITDYGFQWGNVNVSRLAEVRGRKVVRVATPKHDIQIVASPQGNSVQVWKDGERIG